MTEYQRMRDAGDFEAMPKKEALLISRELEKLERNLGGIRKMEKLPDAVFILDTKKEHIAVTEANKLGIPIVAVVDTNCDPDVIQYVIPGNDDAIRSGNLLCRIIADAVEEGRFIAVAPQRRRRPGRRAPAAPRTRRRRSPRSRPRPAARPPPPRPSARPASPRPPEGLMEQEAEAREPVPKPRPSPPPSRAEPSRHRARGRAAEAAPSPRRRRAAPTATEESLTPPWPSSPPRTSRPCARAPAPG